MMDLELDPKVVGVTLLMYALSILGIWKISLLGGYFPLVPRIVISVIALPMEYIIVSMMLND